MPEISGCFSGSLDLTRLEVPEKWALPLSFYSRPTITIARELLGKALLKNVDGSWCGGIIVETEAYLGVDDQASHATIRRTKRNEVMFGEPGHAYVYFIYGMFNCFNAVAYDLGVERAGAVLVRSLEPVVGVPCMKARRKKEKMVELTSGPGKVCQALDINRLDNGSPLWEGNLIVSDPGPHKPFETVTATRIGITKAVELPYRFYVGNCPSVSTYRKTR